MGGHIQWYANCDSWTAIWNAVLLWYTCLVRELLLSLCCGYPGLESLSCGLAFASLWHALPWLCCGFAVAAALLWLGWSGLALLWLYSGIAVTSLWLCCGFAVACCGFAVALLWLCCDFAVALQLLWCGFAVALLVRPGFAAVALQWLCCGLAGQAWLCCCGFARVYLYVRAHKKGVHAKKYAFKPRTLVEKQHDGVDVGVGDDDDGTQTNPMSRRGYCGRGDDGYRVPWSSLGWFAFCRRRVVALQTSSGSSHCRRRRRRRRKRRRRRMASIR